MSGWIAWMLNQFLAAPLRIDLLAQQSPSADPTWWTAWYAWLSTADGRLILATLVGGFGLWCMLPGIGELRKWTGGVLTLIAGGLAFSVVPPLPIDLVSVAFWALAATALAAGVGTVTSRSPVYSAIWFALVLLAVGGLFMVNGAQFLGVATVAVYAGAIVVTFLFVLMLAQPEGHSFYDRISWGQLPSLLSCFASVGLAMLVVWGFTSSDLAAMAVQRTESRVLASEHVAGLGGQLFTRHLLGVQVAGSLLLAALVGAVAMASRGALPRERTITTSSNGAVNGKRTDRGVAT